MIRLSYLQCLLGALCFTATTAYITLQIPDAVDGITADVPFEVKLIETDGLPLRKALKYKGLCLWTGSNSDQVYLNYYLKGQELVYIQNLTDRLSEPLSGDLGSVYTFIGRNYTGYLGDPDSRMFFLGITAASISGRFHVTNFSERFRIRNLTGNLTNSITRTKPSPPTDLFGEGRPPRLITCHDETDCASDETVFGKSPALEPPPLTISSFTTSTATPTPSATMSKPSSVSNDASRMSNPVVRKVVVPVVMVAGVVMIATIAILSCLYNRWRTRQRKLNQIEEVPVQMVPHGAELSAGKGQYDTTELPGSEATPAIELQAGSLRRGEEGRIVIKTKDAEGNPIQIQHGKVEELEVLQMAAAGSDAAFQRSMQGDDLATGKGKSRGDGENNTSAAKQIENSTDSTSRLLDANKISSTQARGERADSPEPHESTAMLSDISPISPMSASPQPTSGETSNYRFSEPLRRPEDLAAVTTTYRVSAPIRSPEELAALAGAFAPLPPEPRPKTPPPRKGDRWVYY